MFMLYQLDSYDNVRRYTLVVETINNVNEDTHANRGSPMSILSIGNTFPVTGLRSQALVRTLLNRSRVRHCYCNIP